MLCSPFCRNKDGVPLRPKRGVKKQGTKDEPVPRDEDNNRISFDQEAFSCAVQNILGICISSHLPVLFCRGDL